MLMLRVHFLGLDVLDGIREVCVDSEKLAEMFFPVPMEIEDDENFSCVLIIVLHVSEDTNNYDKRRTKTKQIYSLFNYQWDVLRLTPSEMSSPRKERRID